MSHKQALSPMELPDASRRPTLELTGSRSAPSVTPGRDAASRAAAGDAGRPAPSWTPAEDAARRPSLEVTSLEYSPDPSRTARADARPSPLPPGDGESLTPGGGGTSEGENPASPMEGFDGAERRCLWCRAPLEVTQVRWCSKKCRQTAWRARRLAVVEDLGDTPKRLAYADPPYPGMSRKYYGDHPDYAGEVDHGRLLEQLSTYDGWALSTSEKTLRQVLALCPPDVRIAPWVKPNGADPRTRGPHNLWEPVIYRPARLRRPGVRDWLSAKPARGGGTLMGRKPVKFCMWLFELLGAAPSDALDDLFPGTRVVSRAFGEFQRVGKGLERREVAGG